MRIMDDAQTRELILKLQDQIRVRTRNATVNGVTASRDINSLGVEVKLEDLQNLINTAGRQNGMIWNGEQWV